MKLGERMPWRSQFTSNQLILRRDSVKDEAHIDIPSTLIYQFAKRKLLLFLSSLNSNDGYQEKQQPTSQTSKFVQVIIILNSRMLKQSGLCLIVPALLGLDQLQMSRTSIAKFKQVGSRSRSISQDNYYEMKYSFT